ncbi:MAG: hypothetical protein ABII00_01515 [Elusimicrobiota bacterium]
MMDVDEFFGARAGFWDRSLARLSLGLILRGARIDPASEIPLAGVPSPLVPGLNLLERAKDGSRGTDLAGDGPGAPVIVGTVRMGFGHHRIAYSAHSWAIEKGMRPYLHDLIGIESQESDVIRRMDANYCRLSRLAADLGGPFDWVWGRLMQQGDLKTLRLFCRLAEAVAPLMRSLPKDVPVIGSHPLNSQIAVACGFRHVINLVIDNYPQYFVMAPGAIHLVQSPAHGMQLVKMGLPQESVRYGGHWVSQDVCANAAEDCARRIERADRGAPRRLLAPVGGAGAQGGFLTDLVKRLGPRLAEGKVRLLLNAGHHRHMRPALERTLNEAGIEFDTVRTWSELEEFCRVHTLSGSEPAGAKPAVLASFEDYFEAFSATDRLIRVSDVLVTKPSELAFYPIPKLHIRRVGGHEEPSAIRSSELGDGSPECREPADAERMAGLLVDDRHMFIRMNESIIRNSAAGVYSGGKTAVELAAELSKV